MNDLREQEDIEALIQRFFAAFDNRNGRVPRQELITELFAERAIIATHRDGQCDLYSPGEFAQPRVDMLRSGDLLEFHEWEETSSTQIVGELATRTSRYAKAGLHLGAEYAGSGTKFFQLAKFASGWRIVALSWIDDPA
jgi:hypothetical protein